MMMSQQKPPILLKKWKELMYAGINAKESDLKTIKFGGKEVQYTQELFEKNK